MGEISTEELKKIADDNGIAVIASHVSLDQIESNPQAIIDRHHARLQTVRGGRLLPLQRGLHRRQVDRLH